MTISEFRAWLDGFKEAIGEAPTPEQWKKVLARVDGVREQAVSPTLPNVWPSPGAPYPRIGDVACGPGAAVTSAQIGSMPGQLNN